jgi:uncharacterized RDD family membrane protein YckC
MNMFLKRLVALLIDGIILAVAAVPTGGFVYVIYEVLLLVLWNGQTIGKKIMGLRVTPQPDWGKAIVRSLMKCVSIAALGLGCFWMLWDPKGETWHDKVSDTRVK